jgi:hypothetical protein
MNQDALKVYFDTEINHILDKIKGIKTDQPDEPYRGKLGPQEEDEIDAGDIDKLKEDMISAHGSGNYFYLNITFESNFNELFLSVRYARRGKLGRGSTWENLDCEL